MYHLFMMFMFRVLSNPKKISSDCENENDAD